MKRRIYAQTSPDWVIRDNIMNSKAQFREMAIQALRRDRARRMIRRMLKSIEMKLTQRAIGRLARRLQEYYKRCRL